MGGDKRCPSFRTGIEGREKQQRQRQRRQWRDGEPVGGERMKTRADEGIENRWKSGAPSSARNRPAGKRDTTGRLHYRAPTCFLSPRRGLPPLACARALLGRVAACRCSPSLARARDTSRFFCPTAYIQIRFVDSLCSAWVTRPRLLSHSFPLAFLPFFSPSLHQLRIPARFSVKRGRSRAR